MFLCCHATRVSVRSRLVHVRKFTNVSEMLKNMADQIKKKDKDQDKHGSAQVTTSDQVAGASSESLATTNGAEALQKPKFEIVLDPFAYRQFDDPTYTGTKITFDKHAFEKKINEIYLERNCELIDGYAPFCKHLFVPNFTGTRANTVEITQGNMKLLMSDYEARASHELPVLVRWFPAHSVTPRVAKYLDVVLYSREQIRKENAATQIKDEKNEDAPWGIVNIKAQDVDHELPMRPITMMRNALGVAEGGSGVPLDRNEYLKAVAYWKNHALIR